MRSSGYAARLSSPWARPVPYEAEGTSTARLIGGPVDDRDIEVREVGSVVRDERCPKPPCESGDQPGRRRRASVRVDADPPKALRPPPTLPGRRRPIEACRQRRSTPRADDPPAVTEAAPELVEDNWAHEDVVIVVSRLAKTRKRRGIPAENLTDDIRVEDEGRHSGVDGTQAHARATQHGVEVLPPLLAAIIGLGREPREPPPERLVLPAGTTPSKALSPWSACHWCSSLTA